MRDVIISITDTPGNIIESFKGELEENEVANAIWRMLPISYRVCHWGESLWMQIPLPGIKTPEEGTVEVEKGDIAYWFPGKQIHIYFGKTPKSKDSTPVPPSPVIPIGSFLDDMERFNARLKERPLKSFLINIDKDIKRGKGE